MLHQLNTNVTSQESKQNQHLQRQQSSSSERASSPRNAKGTELPDRPPIQVKPKGVGPVAFLHENDVLCGRGGRINGHYGNIQFRRFCSERRDEYFKRGIKKIEKAYIAADVVRRIRSLDPPGRFLKQDSDGWYDIGCAKAMTKVGQAIREHTTKEEPAGDMELLSSPCDQNSRDQTIPQTSFAAGPLYPGYHSFEMQHDDQNMITVSNSTSPEEIPSHMMCPLTPLHSEKRLSILSSVSGLSRISSLLRESVQSDLSDSMSVFETPSYMMNGTSAPHRQSIFSDISDGMSMMSLADDHHRRSNVFNTSLKMHEDFDTAAANAYPRLTQYNQTVEQDTMPHEKCQSRLVSSDCSSPTSAPPQQQQKWRQRRRSSIWSMSVASAFSFRSMGSGNNS